MQTAIDHLLCLPTTLLDTNPPNPTHKYLLFLTLARDSYTTHTPMYPNIIECRPISWLVIHSEAELARGRPTSHVYLLPRSLPAYGMSTRAYCIRTLQGPCWHNHPSHLHPDPFVYRFQRFGNGLFRGY
jgi:hypothetical protein